MQQGASRIDEFPNVEISRPLSDQVEDWLLSVNITGPAPSPRSTMVSRCTVIFILLCLLEPPGRKGRPRTETLV